MVDIYGGWYNKSRDARKPAFGYSDQVRHESVCAATKDGEKLEISSLRRRGIVLSVSSESTVHVTAQLICRFVFAYTKKIRFSHDAAHNIQRTRISEIKKNMEKD